MPVVIPVGYGICTWRIENAASGYVNEVTSGFKNDTIFEDPDIIAGFLNENWFDATAIGSLSTMSNNALYIGCRVTYQTPSGPVPGIGVESQVGTDSFAMCSPQVAGVLRKNTAQGGRKGRGRMFLPNVFLEEAAVDAQGRLTVTRNNQLNTQLAAWLALNTGDSVPLYLLHSDATAPSLITSMAADNLVGTQRRRLGRRS